MKNRHFGLEQNASIKRIVRHNSWTSNLGFHVLAIASLNGWYLCRNAALKNRVQWQILYCVCMQHEINRSALVSLLPFAATARDIHAEGPLLLWLI